MPMPFYSFAEIEMFNSLGFGYLLPHIQPHNIYRLAIEEAFIENWQGDFVNALRRAAKALNENKILRLTPEFEKLIYG